MRKKVSTAVFPVAGYGTRCLPATKAIPKEMLTVVDKPLIQYAVEEARQAGIENFIFITSPDKNAIKDHFDASHGLEESLRKKGKDHLLATLDDLKISPGRASYVCQHTPKGLGHSVWCAKSWLKEGEPFAVLLPDDLVHARRSCLAQMVDVYEEGILLAVEDVEKEATQNYGILNIDSDQGQLIKAKSVVEKPHPDEAPSNTAIIGRYILPYEILEVLENQGPGTGGEIQLTDAFNPMIQRGPLYGYRFHGRRFDCGNKYGLLEANIAYACDNPEHLERLSHFLKESGLDQKLHLSPPQIRAVGRGYNPV